MSESVRALPTCPTCGGSVRVVSGDEGTSHFEAVNVNAIFDGIFDIPTEAIDADTGKVRRVDPVEVKDAALGVVVAERFGGTRV